MRQIEIQNFRFGFLSDSKHNADFINFFKETAIRRSGSNAENWNMAVQYFISFAGQQLRFADLKEILCGDYRDFLLKAPSIGRAGRSISTNMSVSYFGKFRAALKAAFKAGYISSNLGERIDGIKARETHREYLSLEELQRSTIDKDWVLGHFIDAIYSIPACTDSLVFKGGTCLKKCFIPDYRFSEDLDFTAIKPGFILDEALLKEITELITERTEIALFIDSIKELKHKEMPTGYAANVKFGGRIT